MSLRWEVQEGTEELLGWLCYFLSAYDGHKRYGVVVGANEYRGRPALWANWTDSEDEAIRFFEEERADRMVPVSEGGALTYSDPRETTAVRYIGPVSFPVHLVEASLRWEVDPEEFKKGDRVKFIGPDDELWYRFKDAGYDEDIVPSAAINQLRDGEGVVEDILRQADGLWYYVFMGGDFHANWDLEGLLPFKADELKLISKEASLRWEIQPDKFKKGDWVQVMSKSVGTAPRESSAQYQIGQTLKVDNVYLPGDQFWQDIRHFIADDLGAGYISKQVPPGEPVYSVGHNFYLAHDLKLVDAPTISSLRWEVVPNNEYIGWLVRTNQYGEPDEDDKYGVVLVVEVGEKGGDPIAWAYWSEEDRTGTDGENDAILKYAEVKSDPEQNALPIPAGGLLTWFAANQLVKLRFIEYPDFEAKGWLDMPEEKRPMGWRTTRSSLRWEVLPEHEGIIYDIENGTYWSADQKPDQAIKQDAPSIFRFNQYTGKWEFHHPDKMEGWIPFVRQDRQDFLNKTFGPYLKTSALRWEVKEPVLIEGMLFDIDSGTYWAADPNENPEIPEDNPSRFRYNPVRRYWEYQHPDIMSPRDWEQMEYEYNDGLTAAFGRPGQSTASLRWEVTPDKKVINGMVFDLSTGTYWSEGPPRNILEDDPSRFRYNPELRKWEYQHSGMSPALWTDMGVAYNKALTKAFGRPGQTTASRWDVEEDYPEETEALEALNRFIEWVDWFFGHTMPGEEPWWVTEMVATTPENFLDTTDANLMKILAESVNTMKPVIEKETETDDDGFHTVAFMAVEVLEQFFRLGIYKGSALRWEVSDEPGELKPGDRVQVVDSTYDPLDETIALIGHIGTLVMLDEEYTEFHSEAVWEVSFEGEDRNWYFGASDLKLVTTASKRWEVEEEPEEPAEPSLERMPPALPETTMAWINAGKPDLPIGTVLHTSDPGIDFIVVRQNPMIFSTPVNPYYYRHLWLDGDQAPAWHWDLDPDALAGHPGTQASQRFGVGEVYGIPFIYRAGKVWMGSAGDDLQGTVRDNHYDILDNNIDEIMTPDELQQGRKSVWDILEHDPHYMRGIFDAHTVQFFHPSYTILANPDDVAACVMDLSDQLETKNPRLIFYDDWAKPTTFQKLVGLEVEAGKRWEVEPIGKEDFKIGDRVRYVGRSAYWDILNKEGKVVEVRTRKDEEHPIGVQFDNWRHNPIYCRPQNLRHLFQPESSLRWEIDYPKGRFEDEYFQKGDRVRFIKDWYDDDGTQRIKRTDNPRKEFPEGTTGTIDQGSGRHGLCYVRVDGHEEGPGPYYGVEGWIEAEWPIDADYLEYEGKPVESSQRWEVESYFRPGDIVRIRVDNPKTRHGELGMRAGTEGMVGHVSDTTRQWVYVHSFDEGQGDIHWGAWLNVEDLELVSQREMTTSLRWEVSRPGPYDDMNDDQLIEALKQVWPEWPENSNAQLIWNELIKRGVDVVNDPRVLRIVGDLMSEGSQRWEIAPEIWGETAEPLGLPEFVPDRDIDTTEPIRIVYLNGGDVYIGQEQFSQPYLKKILIYALQVGQTGYLAGFRDDVDGLKHVICYFGSEPSFAEIMRRRSNGFREATWHSLRG